MLEWGGEKVSYLSKQRVDRILGHCFKRSWTGKDQDRFELSRNDCRVTTVRSAKDQRKQKLRRKQIARRVLVGFEKLCSAPPEARKNEADEE
jgi:hypothetical protein